MAKRSVQAYIEEVPSWDGGARLAGPPLSGMQWLVWSLATAGKFFEGLIVFMGGIALPLIAEQFAMTSTDKGLVTAATLAGILIGALALGGLPTQRTTATLQPARQHLQGVGSGEQQQAMLPRHGLRAARGPGCRSNAAPAASCRAAAASPCSQDATTAPAAAGCCGIGHHHREAIVRPRSPQSC